MNQFPQFSLQGKVAIISGASRGIGEAIAHTYARAGAKVVLASRKIDGLAAVASAIKDEGGDATAIAAHMGDQNAIRQLVEQEITAYGGVDIVVNNAATNPHFGPLLTSEESMWDKTLDVNLRGYFRLIRECVPRMAERGGGKIVNMASIAGLSYSPLMALYSLTTAAVIMMTRSLADDLAPQNIQITPNPPAVIHTPVNEAI